MATAGFGPRLQECDERVPGIGGDVERGKVETVLCRRHDTGLVFSVEGVLQRRAWNRILTRMSDAPASHA